MSKLYDMGQHKMKIEACQHYSEEIAAIVDQLVQSSRHGVCFEHRGHELVVSRGSSADLIQRTIRILYPGYFGGGEIELNLFPYFSEEVAALFQVLSRQLAQAFRYDHLHTDQPWVESEQRGQQTALRFLREMPKLRVMLATDVLAAYEGDPAAKSYDEIIFSYPGLFAITVYRIAHQLYEQDVSLIPRVMTEYAHSLTGIDIHPGARIGESFFIDHGTGVVVGETTEIGNRVRLYQGVTLGALSVPKDQVHQLRNKKRHPTIENDVIIYAGATILGGNTIIGARSVIGGNVWLTDSVPPDTRVFLKKPELIFEENRIEQTCGERQKAEAEHE